MQNAPGPDVSDIVLPAVAGRYELGPLANLGRPGLGASAPIHLTKFGDAKAAPRLLFVLPSAASASPSLLRALACEVELLCEVNHPGVARVREFVQHEGVSFVAFDAPGVSLGRLLHAAVAARVRIPAAVISSIVLSALDGLAAIHDALGAKRTEARSSLREFGPESIWVDAGGYARVLDVGYGRALEAGDPARRNEASWSLPYASPEQVTGTPAGFTSDTYSACVVLWEALTETRLFARHSRQETIDAILEGDIPPTEAMNLGSGLDLSWIMRGLAFDGPRRYATARDLARALREKIAPASSEIVADWLRRLSPKLGVVRAETFPSALEAEDTDAMRVSSLSQPGVLDGSDELTLIACEVTDDGPAHPSLGPTEASERVKKLAQALGVAPTAHAETAHEKRRQYTLDSVSPKLIERLAAAEAAEARPKSSASSDPPMLSGVTSVIAPSQSASSWGASARLVMLVAAGVVAGTVVSVLVALRIGEPARAPIAGPAIVVAAQAEPPTCPAAPEHAANPLSYNDVVAPRPAGHTQRVQPAPANRVAPVAVRELNVEVATTPVVVEETPSPIVVPRSLHPRPNPLMSSKQVFTLR